MVERQHFPLILSVTVQGFFLSSAPCVSFQPIGLKNKPASHKIALRSYDLYFKRNQTVNAKHAHKGLIHILPNPALISFLPYFKSKQSHELSLTQLLPPSISHGMWDAFRDQQPHNPCLILNLPKKSLQTIYVKQFLTPYNYNKTIFPILQHKCCEAFLTPYIITTRQSYEYNSANAVKLGPVVGFANICFTNPTP